MELKNFDYKLVRIEDVMGKVYEGYCSYNCKDYNFHEFGEDEDGVQLSTFLFYASDIKNIEIIKEFSEPYGLLEEETIDEGMPLIDEVLESEDNEHILRLLLCLENRLKNDNVKLDKKQLKELLEKQLKYSDSIIQEQVKKVIDQM